MISRKAQSRFVYLFIIISIILLIIVRAGGIGDISSDEKNKPSDTLILHKGISEDVYKTSDGKFKSIIYSGVVNVPYENSYIPVTDYMNVTQEGNKIKISEKNGKSCYISLDYSLIDSKSIGSEKISFNISKSRTSYYFVSNIDKAVSSMNYYINCSDYKIEYDDKTDKLNLDNVQIDFQQAKIDQNIKTIYNSTTNKLQFSIYNKSLSADLSKIDPKVKYNFNNTYQGTWATSYECGNNTALVNTNKTPNCRKLIAENTAGAGLDTPDDATYTNTQSVAAGINVWQVFNFNLTQLNVNKSDISSINFTWYGKEDANVQNLLLYSWNDSINSWSVITNKTPSTSLEWIYYKTHNTNLDVLDSNNISRYLIYYLVDNNVRQLTTDYVFLEVTYDTLIINSPTNSQQIINSMSTNLNTSQSGYNNTIWYSWNNGIKNYTLCTNSNECQSSITFPRQGYYNITVWANKSDNGVTRRVVSNIDVINRTRFNSINDTTITDGNSETISFVKFDLSSFNNSNLTIPLITYYFYETNHGPSGWSTGYLETCYIYNQTWAYTKINNTSAKNIYNNRTDCHIHYPFTSFTGNKWGILNITNNTYNITNQKNHSIIIKNNRTFFDQTESNYNFDITWGVRVEDSNGKYNWWDAQANYYGLNKPPYMNITYYTIYTAPSIINLLANQSNFTTSTVNFTYNITDDNDYLLNISIFLDGVLNNSVYNVFINSSRYNTFNFSVNGLSNGLHSYFIQAYDSDATESNSSNYTILIDSLKPNLKIITPNNNTNSTNNYLNINFTASDLHLDSCWYTNDTESINTTISCSTNITTIKWAEGNHNVTIYSNDTFNNLNKTSVSFFIDTLVPEVTFLFPPDDGYSFDYSLNIPFNISVYDSGIGLSSCWWSNSSGLANHTVTCGNNISVTQSGDGAYNITFWANDTLNNINKTVRNFIINTVNPSIVLYYPDNDKWLNYSNVIFNFSVADAHPISVCQLYGNWSGNFILNQTLENVGNSSNLTNFNSIQLKVGTYKWNVWCNESNGLSSWYGINRTINVDTIFPIINYENMTSVNYANVSRSNIFINISWIEENYKNITFILDNSTKPYNRVTYFRSRDNIYTMSEKNIISNENKSVSQNLPKQQNERVRALIEISKPVINYSLGISVTKSGSNLTGLGQTACVLDTGIDTDHESLINNIVVQYCYCGNETNYADPGGCCPNNLSEDINAEDVDGHGTHVSGIIAANGTIQGIAPLSKIVSIKVLNDSGEGWSEDIIKGINWCINNRTKYNISVISISIGSGLYSGYCDSLKPEYSAAINNATFYNIPVAIATGNDGNYTHIAAPACIKNATRVSIVNQFSDIVTNTANRNNITKIFAPGKYINSTWNDGNSKIDSGTSMSTPMVAGTILLMKQYAPTASFLNIEELLYNHGKLITDTNNYFAIVDIFGSLEGLSNYTSNNFTSLPDDNYNYSVEICDKANNCRITAQRTIMLDTLIPSIKVNSSFSNNSYLNYNNIKINITNSDIHLQTCWYRFDGSTTLYTCGNNFTATKADGFYTFEAFANDTVNNTNSSERVSFTVDTTYPLSLNLNIVPTTGTTINVYHNASDTNLLSCKFSILNSSGNPDGVYNNVSTNCNVSGTTLSVSLLGTYNFTLYVLDKAGNENVSIYEFTTTGTPMTTIGGGGGGGVNQSRKWELTSDANTKYYNFQIVKGGTRQKSLLFTNYDVKEHYIDISCEGDLCLYINITNSSIKLPVAQTIQSEVPFTLSLPTDLETKAYTSNIIGTDETGLKDFITVEVGVGLVGIPLDIIKKFVSAKVIGGISIPYIFFFLLFAAAVFVFLNYVALRKLRIGLAISLIVSFLSGLVLLIFI